MSTFLAETATPQLHLALRLCNVNGYSVLAVLLAMVAMLFTAITYGSTVIEPGKRIPRNNVLLVGAVAPDGAIGFEF